MKTTRNSDFFSRSGSIISGGQAQQFAPARADRQGLAIRNVSAGSLWVNDAGEDALMDEDSLEIKAGEYYEWPYIPNGVVSVIGATTSQAFYGRDW
jgi:hypothetical protein